MANYPGVIECLLYYEKSRNVLFVRWSVQSCHDISGIDMVNFKNDDLYSVVEAISRRSVSCIHITLMRPSTRESWVLSLSTAGFSRCGMCE